MDVYEIVTAKVIESFDKGIAPWRCPWTRGKAGLPVNLVSKKHYSGINPFLLQMASIVKGYSSPYWLTYKQAAELGGQVRKGEKSEIVVFWKTWDVAVEPTTDSEEASERRWVLRYYNVFNSDQVDGLGDKVPATGPTTPFEHNPIDSCETILSGMSNRPAINEIKGNRAFYRPSSDCITVPVKAQFENVAEFYSTLFHELGHSTGHESRLNRPGITELNGFGSHEYSKEELVAEFTACYLCGMAGIENRTIENSAAYLRSWSEVLKAKANKKWLVWAASHAVRAAKYILNETTAELSAAA
jgi:antirestriction protein ArdC